MEYTSGYSKYTMTARAVAPRTWLHPRVTDDLDKHVKVGFHATHAERLELQKAARAAGMTMTSFLLTGAELLKQQLEENPESDGREPS